MYIHNICIRGLGAGVAQVCIASAYRLDGRGINIVQAGSADHSASYPVGTGASSPGGKAAEL
jgi:hypothetical protein